MALEKDELHLEQRIPCPHLREGGRVERSKSGRAGQSNELLEADFPVGRGRVRPKIYGRMKQKQRTFALLPVRSLEETHLTRSQQKTMGHKMNRQKDGFGAPLATVWCGRDSDVSKLPNVGTKSSQ